MFSNNATRTDGDLIFLTDSAYFSLLDDETNSRSSKGKQKHDGLFLERLDSFIEAQFRDIDAFANREQRTFDEIRRLVAVSHAKFLFSNSSATQPSQTETDPSVPSVRSTLAKLSSNLQILHSTAGLDSLLLVVSPSPLPSSTSISALDNTASTNFTNSSEASWIGGTDLGKEFWMGLKGGGANGAKAFRKRCQMRHEAQLLEQELEYSALVAPVVLGQVGSTPFAVPVETRKSRVKSGDIKTELNAVVRHALRSVSGNPSAEMRWTKPESLEELYGVRLVGWPATVERRNPSNNSVKDNKLLLDSIRRGHMKFVQKGSLEWNLASSISLLDSSSLEATAGGDSHLSPSRQLQELFEGVPRSEPARQISEPSGNLASISHGSLYSLNPSLEAMQLSMSREVLSTALYFYPNDSPQSKDKTLEKGVAKRRSSETEMRSKRRRVEASAGNINGEQR